MKFKIKKSNKRLVGADFSALEVRTSAFCAQDQSMIEAYREGKDLYSKIASIAYNMPYEDCLEFYPEGTKLIIDGKEIICGYKNITNKDGKARRQAAKSILIGSIYGRGAASIAEQIGKTKEETQDIMDKFFAGFPALRKWMDNSIKFTEEHGYMDNFMGRRRRLPDALLPRYSIKATAKSQAADFNPFIGCKDRVNELAIQKYTKLLETIKYRKEYETIQAQALKEGIEIHDNNGLISQTQRQCVNFQAQSLGADIIKKVMIEIDRNEELKNLGFDLLLTIHDEVIGQCPEENAEKILEIIKNIMVSTPKKYNIDMPMSADGYIVKNWYEDEMISVLESEYMKDCDKMSSEEAFEKLVYNHPELLRTQIENVIHSQQELLFV